MLTSDVLARFGLPAEAIPCRCQSCDWRGDYEQGVEVDCVEVCTRIEVGEPFMDRECPACGALLALLSADDLLQAAIDAIPVPEGLTRYRVIQHRDAFANYFGFVDADSPEAALDKGMNDDLLGPLTDNWRDEGTNTYDDRHIGVETIDGETLIEPKED